MNIEVSAVPEMECAGVETKDRSLSVQPIFWSPNELANVAAIVVKNNQGKVLFKGLLRVSGRNGKPTITSRAQPVTPLVDRNKK